MILLQLAQFLESFFVSVDPESPLAYIDPGTGGMLFQVLAIMFAAFSGILFFFSRQIKAGFASFRRRLRGEAPVVEVEDEAVPGDEEVGVDGDESA